MLIRFILVVFHINIISNDSSIRFKEIIEP